MQEQDRQGTRGCSTLPPVSSIWHHLGSCIHSALRGLMTLDVQVMEKAPVALPVTANAKQRLRNAFGLVKSQVDMDLLQYRKDVAALLRRDGILPDDEELLHKWVP